MHAQKKREKYFNHLDDGQSRKEASALVRIGYSTGAAWERRRQATGSRKPPGGRDKGPPSAITLRKQEVLDFLLLQGRATCKEIANHMKTKGLDRSESAYSRQFKRWGVFKRDGQWRLPGERPRSGKSLVKARRMTKLAGEDERIIEMAELGATLDEIVDHLNRNCGIECTAPAVAYRLNLNGVELRNSRKEGQAHQDLQSVAADESESERMQDCGKESVPVARSAAPLRNMLHAYQEEILSWCHADPERISLGKIAGMLLENHGVRTSNPTISKLLKHHGIQLKTGRKRKGGHAVEMDSGRVFPPDSGKTEESVSLSILKGNFKAVNYYDMIFSLRGLVQRFNQTACTMGLKDLRDRSITCSIGCLLVIVMLAVGSGRTRLRKAHYFLQENQSILSKILDLPRGVPSGATLRRFLHDTDPELLSRVVFKVTARPETDDHGYLALAADGQMLRGATGGDQVKPPGVLSVFAQHSKQVVAAIPCGKAGAERVAFRTLLPLLKEDLDLEADAGTEDVIFTADALHCQAKTLNRIRDLGFNFCMPLKGNNKILKNVVDECILAGLQHDQSLETSENSHGRDERRIYKSFTPPPEVLDAWERMFKNEKHAPKLEQIIAETTIRNTKQSFRTILLSKKLDIETAAKIIRNHWSVEVNVHYVADTRFCQDFIRAYSGNIAMNTAILVKGFMNLVERFMPELPATEKYNMSEVSLNKIMQIVASAMD